MSLIYKQQWCCSPSATSDAYIYAIAPVIDTGIAAITSADELLIVDGSNLQSNQVLKFQNAPKRLTCLATADDGNTILCAGSDGFVATFDVRSRKRTAEYNIGTDLLS